LVLGTGAAVLLLVAGGIVGLMLFGKPAARPGAVGAAPTSAGGPAASTAAAPAASTNTGVPLAAGSCVLVTSTTSGTLDNAKLVPQSCTESPFAAVLARVADRAQCPEGTISRIADGTGVLCLGQSEHGTIAKPGDCVRIPTGFQLPLIRTDCATSSRPIRLVAIVDEIGACPSGTQGHPYSGYDRPLCLLFPGAG
jgi:hypothetical protein